MPVAVPPGRAAHAFAASAARRSPAGTRSARPGRRGCGLRHGRAGGLAAADASAGDCPACGVFASQVKGSATTRPRDIPYGERVLELLWQKRRWWCREPASPRPRPLVRGMALFYSPRTRRPWERSH
ncbi:transposase family protein [Streptomyces sp. NBC_00285]|uniref:transposase family protein n=1 Tax=Streptomyces sp. NBC_00285 TaxID=2975700 RepID=UPI003FA73E70